MDLAERIYIVGMAGRFRRAAAAQRSVRIVAGTVIKLQDGGADCTDLLYVSVQVAAGSAAPLIARFSTSNPGTTTNQWNFVTDGAFYETVINGEKEELFVECELATQLLVQMVAFK